MGSEGQSAMNEKNQDLCWGKIAAMNEIMEQNAQQADRLLDVAGLLEGTARLLNETLRDARADRMTDILSARLDAMLQAQQQRKARAA
jgi:hypothetical protein